jgi:hypothetical protein
MSFHPQPLSRLPALAAVVVALGGCAGYGPQSLKTGATVDQAVAVMGAPTGRYRTAAGERVEYARGPYGKHTYMLDFDSQGRLTGWEQVLVEPVFNAIIAGMTQDELLMRIGHPSDSIPLRWQRRTLWSYRYDTPFCKWFQVGIDERKTVVDTGYGPDPLCNAQMASSPQ